MNAVTSTVHDRAEELLRAWGKRVLEAPCLDRVAPLNGDDSLRLTLAFRNPLDGPCVLIFDFYGGQQSRHTYVTFSDALGALDRIDLAGVCAVRAEPINGVI